MEYKKLLEKAMKDVPKDVENKKRFEKPEINSSIQGSKTMIYNFSKICDLIDRDINHVKKFLDRELATNGVIQDQSVVFVGRFRRDVLGGKLDKYMKEFVFCKECNKPDTKIEKEDRISFLKCSACGAKRPVRTLK